MADDTGHDTGPLQVVPDTGTPRWSGSALRWSAARAARETGAARSTILNALQSGRLEGSKDDAGAWQITPEALGAAGFTPGRPAPADPLPLEDDRDDAAALRLELAEARADARVAGVERDAERRLREAAERERDVYRRMIEQSPQSPQSPPESPQTPATPEPDQTPTPTPDRPPRANAGRFRRAWNVARYG